MSVETVQEQTIEDNDLAIDLIAKINQDPGNAVTYLIEHSNKYDKSHIHLLLTLIENGRYKDAESSFLALPMDRLEPNRMHKHINDISNKIHDHVEEINRDLEETDPQQKINEDMGRGRKKRLYFKYFPEAATVIYDTKETITEVLSIEE